MPKRNKLVYSCTIKIRATGFDELLESILYLLLVVKAFSFSLQKVVKMLEEAVVSWLLGNMAGEIKHYSPIHSTFEVLVV